MASSTVVVLGAIEHVFQAIGRQLNAATSKSRESWAFRRWRWRRLLEHPVDGSSYELAHRAILGLGHRPQLLHHRVGEQNLNLLHGSMLKT
jgi:hypothetical protein